MDIISKHEWEYIKQQPSFWNKYTHSIPIDDRDLAILDLGDQVVLPKFFIQNNYEELYIHQIGHDIINRREKRLKDIKSSGTPLTLMETSIEPRKEQIPIFDAIRNKKEFNEPINGLVIAQPGFGKSLVGIKTVELLSTKSLIIVPNDILEEQFVESIIEFTNLQKEDIGVIQGSDINDLIKKGVYEKDIVVAKIQSLYAQLKVINIMELEELYSVFGLVIYDEAHVGNASDGYSKTGNMFRTDNIISMTATPYRSGINEFIFKNNTGGVLYQSDHQNLIPTINLHNGIIEFDDQELRRLQFARTDYVRFMATYNMILETKDAYFEWIANWVEYRASQGHNVAVLFATNKMVKKLSNILTRKGIDNGLLTGQTEKKPEVSKEYLTISQVQVFYDNYFKVFPKRKKCPVLKPFKNDVTKYSLTKHILKDLDKIQATIPTLELETSWTKVNTMTEREIMKSKNVIVSNFKLLSAGFDKSELSCIIFGSIIVGKVPVIQSLGRICRTHPDKIQDVHAHFMFTQTFINFFPDMMFTLTSNIKLQYPSKITYEGFDFEKKEAPPATIKAAPVQHKN